MAKVGYITVATEAQEMRATTWRNFVQARTVEFCFQNAERSRIYPSWSERKNIVNIFTMNTTLKTKLKKLNKRWEQ